MITKEMIKEKIDKLHDEFLEKVYQFILKIKKQWEENNT